MSHVELATAAVREHHAIQQAEELAVLVERVTSLDPLNTVIEIGCDAGGTLWAWSQLCARVYGITLPLSPPGEGVFPQGRYPLERHGASVLLGDSHQPPAPAWLAAQLGGDQADFLFIDGDHQPDGVMADFTTYRRFVRPGGLIALDDVLNPDLDVRKAWTHVTALPGYHTEVICAGGMPAGIGLVHVPA